MASNSPSRSFTSNCSHSSTNSGVPFLPSRIFPTTPDKSGIFALFCPFNRAMASIGMLVSGNLEFSIASSVSIFASPSGMKSRARINRGRSSSLIAGSRMILPRYVAASGARLRQMTSRPGVVFQLSPTFFIQAVRHSASRSAAPMPIASIDQRSLPSCCEASSAHNAGISGDLL